MSQYSLFRQLARMFRFLEASVVVFLLSWSLAHLPAAARPPIELLRHHADVLLGPRFLFLLGNAIVLILFANSWNSTAATDNSEMVSELNESRILAHSPLPEAAQPLVEETTYDDSTPATDNREMVSELHPLVEEITYEGTTAATDNCEMVSEPHESRILVHCSLPEVAQPLVREIKYEDSIAATENCEMVSELHVGRTLVEEAITYEDKAVCVEERRMCKVARRKRGIRTRQLVEKNSEGDCGIEKSETVKVRDGEDEEFTRTVEAFIAKQLRFRMEESLRLNYARD